MVGGKAGGVVVDVKIEFDNFMQIGTTQKTSTTSGRDCTVTFIYLHILVELYHTVITPATLCVFTCVCVCLYVCLCVHFIES